MAVLGGYVQKFLHIDLTGRRIESEIPETDLLRSFVGGYGLGARILYERMAPGIDPFGPENILGFVSGPLTGTPALLGSRYAVVSKSPLTGGWGDANSGGDFGPYLKFAGYDALFIQGVSGEPVYILIDDGQVEFYSAQNFWGLDTYETVQALREVHGSDARVACVGPAGERRILSAGVFNDGGRTAARSGLGAVMGAKQLKAIVLRGAKAPAIAHPERVNQLRTHYLGIFKTDEEAQLLRQYGTSGAFKMLAEIGRTPILNYRGTYPRNLIDPDALDGPAVISHQKKRHACWHCSLACSGIMHWDTQTEVLGGEKPEYESLAMLGASCGITDLKTVMKLNDRCNHAGLDTISIGATIAFAMECYENGVITLKDADGLRLEWGNGEAALGLLEMIVERRGVGDLLAEGVWRASRQLGQGSEAYAIHAGGQELPAHDPRHMPDFGLAYQISPTPGRHTQGGIGGADLPPKKRLAYNLDDQLEQDDPLRYHAIAYARLNAWNNVVNSAGFCAFGTSSMGPESVPEFLAAITGWDFDMQECITAGTRIEVIRHLFGLREGYNPLNIRVASRAMGDPPQEDGPTAGRRVDVDGLRNEYLHVMGIDPSTAMPDQIQLQTLGLQELVERYHTEK